MTPIIVSSEMEMQGALNRANDYSSTAYLPESIWHEIRVSNSTSINQINAQGPS